ncbi:MAG TPA: hypothetical protein VI386_32030 [Candidatus Sulfotelmatobacter sp.]
MISPFFSVQNEEGVWLLRLESADGTNRLTSVWVSALTEAVRYLSRQAKPITTIATALNLIQAGLQP